MGLGLQPSCRDEVTRELLELRRRSADYVRLDGAVAADEYFYAELNAGVAQHAEEYYRTMLDPGVSSWNLRDRHMFETLEQLASHLGRNGRSAKIVVWAHNSHVGDAAVTDMGRRGEINIGSHRFHHVQRNRKCGVELGRAGRAQSHPPSSCGKLRRALPPHRRSAVLAEIRR